MLMVEDVFWRLVGRTRQAIRRASVGATHPFQYALSTREGTACVAHVVQALASLDPSVTILSNRWRWGQRYNFLKGDVVSWPHGHGRRGDSCATVPQRNGKMVSGMFVTCAREKVASKETL